MVPTLTKADEWALHAALLHTGPDLSERPTGADRKLFKGDAFSRREPVSAEREPEIGSFRADLDEILARLAHEGVIGAGWPRREPPVEQRPASAARCPAYHNQALFEGADD